MANKNKDVMESDIKDKKMNECKNQCQVLADEDDKKEIEIEIAMQTMVEKEKNQVKECAETCNVSMMLMTQLKRTLGDKKRKNESDQQIESNIEEEDEKEIMSKMDEDEDELVVGMTLTNNSLLCEDEDSNKELKPDVEAIIEVIKTQD